MNARALPLLYVDDEPDNVALFRLQFAREFNVRTAAGADEALRVLESEDVALLVTDERMPKMSGVELLARVVERWPDVVRVIVSAYGDAQRLLLAINRGHAHEYVLKPWEKPELGACLDRALVSAERRRELVRRAQMAEVLVNDPRGEGQLANAIVAGEGLRETLAVAARAARSDATVLLTGETGTGKELIARAIHDGSARAQRPFVRVNCAALAEGLLESELFGHEQGAFTGAHARRAGRFELAHKGTIFLDEIGDISAKAQVSLLRVLQEREIERVGGQKTIAVDVRVVAATHRDLPKLVAHGTFREDLYYRLNVLPIRVPPLRDRPDDIELLARHFIAKHALASAPPATLGEGVIDRLREYAWPGNVRELENLVQRALVLSDGEPLTLEDFSFNLLTRQDREEPVDEARDAHRDGDRPREDAEDDDDPESATPVREKARQSEARALRKLLLANGGNCTRAARALGVPRTTFVSRAKRHGLL